VHPLTKKHVLEFLEELYKSKAIDRKKSLASLVDNNLIDELYDKNKGMIRLILKDLSACVIKAAVENKPFIDRGVYQKTIADTLQDYLASLQPREAEYKILSHLLKKNDTYTRDEELSKKTGLEKSSLGNKLQKMQE
jgi:uncharacterized membrane protein YheB (UPF0754 family)